MIAVLLLLSLFLGILSVANKILLLKRKRSGWSSGMVIGAVSAFYFFWIDLYVLAVAEAGFFAVMFYGYLRSASPTQKHRLLASVLLSFLSVLTGYVVFSGKTTVVEGISSLGFIWAGYQLATGKWSSGWLLFAIAHIATCVAAFSAGQAIFAGLQTISGAVCVYALIDSMAHLRHAELHGKSQHEPTP